ncbi:MAG: 8-oxo-dGTP diphosphatase MutT [Victivallaceae bacterium]|nr:8-oxo-dGTP diphosphatase MutT [Victivallaceae bacterium]
MASENNNKKKTVKVVAAIIVDGGRVFATQRGYGDFKDGWEFPGGKIESGETPQEALKREISEELGILISVGELFRTVEFEYPAFHLSMQCFICRIEQGTPVLAEHEDARWVDANEIETLSWLPADHGLVREIRDRLLDSAK